MGRIVGLANRLLDNLAILVGELAQDFMVDVLANFATSVLGHQVKFTVEAKQCMMLISLEVVLEDLLVELFVLPI